MKKIILSSLLILSSFVQGQNNDKLFAFLDCPWGCDQNYIQTEIPYINFIREPKESKVHIIVAQNESGAGGNSYSFRFIGQQEFTHLNDTLIVNMRPDASDDETRIAHVDILNKGLFDFVKHSSVANNISIVYKPIIVDELLLEKDPWSYWVYKIRANARLNGRETYKSEYLSLRLSGNKITEKLKVESSLNLNHEKNIFLYDGEKTIITTESNYANLLVVKSVNKHISVGAFTDYTHSTYSNLKSGISFLPAIEYNIFPYSEANEHQLRFLYGIGNQYNNYIDTTIFFKTTENYFFQELSVNYESIQKWGSIDIGLQSKDLFLPGNKFDLNLNCNLDIRILKGLNLNTWFSFEFNRSQIELSGVGVNYEDVLLQQKELASNYNYYAFIGLSYTFGSLYNNVVNTRFD